jgi:phosphorylcholine metabolism protein LicD
MTSYIKEVTDKWWLKKVLKPAYMPLIQWFKFKKANRQFQKHGASVLELADKAFKKSGVFYWLEFGTLLGVYRDGKLIEYDTDLDVGVFLNDYSINLEIELKKLGFKQEHEFLVDDGLVGREQTFSRNGINLDVFYFQKTEDGMFCHLFPYNEQKQRVVRQINTSVNTFKTKEWQSITVNIPEDTNQRLTDTYGDYSIKIKDWYTPDAALNSEIINKKIKELKY